MKKNGISLIVLIVTIIVVIILAAAVILTLSKNNPIESAKEARFKEDVRTFQDELALAVSKEYTTAGGHRDEKITTSDFDEIREFIPSFSEKYRDKICIVEDNVRYLYVNSKEKEWLNNLNILPDIVLPTGYQRIEYLETTGTQYIFTELDDDMPWKCVVEFEFTSDSNRRNCIFGCNYASNERFFSIDNDKKMVMYINLNRVYDNYNIDLNKKYRIEYDCHNNSYVKINDETIFSKTTNYVKMTDSKIPFMACTRDGQMNNGNAYKSHAKYYYAEFYDNDYNLCHKFIPALDNNLVPCMYDMVTNKPFYNDGEGEFLTENEK